MESTASKSNQNVVSVQIEVEPDQVFAALTNAAAHLDWARGPEEIRNLSESPAKLGTSFQQVAKIMGRKLVAECQVNLYEENRRFGFNGNKPFPFQVRWDLEQGASGTLVTMSGQFEPDGFLKIATPLLNSSMESQMNSDMLSLKAVLEAEA